MGEREKIISFKDQQWRLSKVAALVGSNIVRRYIASGYPQPQQFFGALSDEDAAAIQKTCLLAVSQIGPDGKPLPIMMVDGRWAITPEPDAEMIYSLALASLAFQLQDFFGADALKELGEIITGLFPVNAST
jgi:hypothetical protein